MGLVFVKLGLEKVFLMRILLLLLWVKIWGESKPMWWTGSGWFRR